MTTKRESILAAIATALVGTTGVSTRIYRSRVEPIARGESPAIVIEPINDIAQQNTERVQMGHQTRWTAMDFKIRQRNSHEKRG